MAHFDLSLIEWPDDDEGGPRLLGRITDPDLIELARDRIAAARRRELARIEGPRLVPSPRDGKGA